MEKKYLLFGTAKGLLIFERTKKGWRSLRTDFLGMPVSAVHIAEGRWWVSLAHKHWGTKLHVSDNEGRTWRNIATPKYPAYAELSAGKPAKLQSVWAFAHTHTPQNGLRLYAGTEPGGLFFSDDEGAGWQLVEGLWAHPSRQQHWFGGGRGKNTPGIHSIAFDPKNPAHGYVGISCAGVFETTDAGQQWQPRNKGLRADFLPDPYAEVGHDPHRLLMTNTDSAVLWQQSHYGVFRSTDAGASWHDISDPSQQIGYGFALAVSETSALEAWVIPAESDDLRTAPRRRLFVARTTDGGATWQRLQTGLPQQNCYDLVLRHALALSGDWLAFGTNAGNSFFSDNRGEQWHLLAHYLPPVFVAMFA